MRRARSSMVGPPASAPPLGAGGSTGSALLAARLGGCGGALPWSSMPAVWAQVAAAARSGTAAAIRRAGKRFVGVDVPVK